MLKEQNRLLTQVGRGWGCGWGLGRPGQALTALPPPQEVTDKSERITQLESTFMHISSDQLLKLVSKSLIPWTIASVLV